METPTVFFSTPTIWCCQLLLQKEYVAEASEGNDAIEINYRAEEESSEDNPQAEPCGLGSSGGAAKSVRFADIQEPVQNRIGAHLRRRSRKNRQRFQAEMVYSFARQLSRQRSQSAQPVICHNCRAAVQEPPFAQYVRNNPEKGKIHHHA